MSDAATQRTRFVRRDTWSLGGRVDALVARVIFSCRGHRQERP